MNVLFVNPRQQQCGVHQYGKRFYSLLKLIPSVSPSYVETSSNDKGVELGLGDGVWGNEYRASMTGQWDVVILNYHPGITNACSDLTRWGSAKIISIFHEGAMNAPVDAWIVSDPSMNSGANIHAIGRPLPEVDISKLPQHQNEITTIGLSGFLGAWAIDMVTLVSEHLPTCRIRLHLPYSAHMDPGGAMAHDSAAQCRQVHKSQLEVTHEFMDEAKMIHWLNGNCINAYIRPYTGSMGISSALDMALACRRPIAINKNSMFRYLHNCSPSICIEDTPLRKILENDCLPLFPHWERNRRENVAKEIEAVLMKVAA